MASIKYSPKDIYEQEFKTSLRGFDKVEVDEFLDDVISDYELFLAEIKKLKKENEELKAKIKELEEAATVADFATIPPYGASQYVEEPVVEEVVEEKIELTTADTSVPHVSNYDLLRRISRLELEVFGKNLEA